MSSSKVLKDSLMELWNDTYDTELLNSFLFISIQMVEALQKSNFLKIAHGKTEWVMAEVIAYVSATRQAIYNKEGKNSMCDYH